ncbi:MAG: carboxylating nicotinate-nucleotide diphosphorylase [Deltaproteobacteria bacterium]|nr:MAG: carboxylating nicotinate-nucleotide diphosphorylase [Deltaproteobacteria bacterium]
MIDGIQAIIDLALWEDIGHQDLTTKSLIDEKEKGAAILQAKEAFLLAGMEVFSRVFFRLEKEIEINSFFSDGAEIKKGDVIAELKGPLWALLSGERTALNFLQRLSGIATYTREVVKKVEGYPVRILDTRKTTPGWRLLEKSAVRVGGGFNHRFGLFDGVLIKDNHIRAVGSIAKAVEIARAKVPLTMKIEVEVNSLKEVEEALKAKADIIMLDNMSLEEMKLAVDKIEGRAIVEASGGITLENIESVAKTGVDFISMGVLTHSVKAVDISMELEKSCCLQ